MNNASIRIVSVNVGKAAQIGTYRGKPVVSGIRKMQVDADQRVLIEATNLVGDAQADLRVHGGVDKAVYAYPSENIEYWNNVLQPSPPFQPGTFGENLTIQGWSEDDVYIGDVWRWGSAVLQVSQPRFPCYKLGIATGTPGIIAPFVESGRTGWYLRVLQPGSVLVGEAAILESRGQGNVTVRQAHSARLPQAPVDEIARVANVEGLAESVRSQLIERLR